MNKIHFGLRMFFGLSLLVSALQLYGAQDEVQNIDADINAFAQDGTGLLEQAENIPLLGMLFKSKIMKRAIIPGAACGGIAAGFCVIVSSTPVAVPLGVVTGCAAGAYNYHSYSGSDKFARVFRAFGIKIDQVQAGQEAMKRDIAVIKDDTRAALDGIGVANQKLDAQSAKLDANAAGVGRLEAGQKDLAAGQNKIQHDMCAGFTQTSNQLQRVEKTVLSTQKSMQRAIGQHGQAVNRMSSDVADVKNDVAAIKAMLQIQTSSTPQIQYLQPPKPKARNNIGGVRMDSSFVHNMNAQNMNPQKKQQMSNSTSLMRDSIKPLGMQNFH